MIMNEYRKGGHTQYDLKIHLVWTTKYRYKLLRGAIGYRLRELIRQGCEARNIRIVDGNVRSDHVHLLLSIPPSMSVSQVAQYLKGRSSHLLQDEFPQLKKRYWGQHMWGRGYFCASVGNVTEDMIKAYIENQGNDDNFKVEE